MQQHSTRLSVIQRKMSLGHMENMPLHQVAPSGAQRPGWKLWVFSALALVLLVCSVSTVVFALLSLKTVSTPCVAKFGPLPSKWKMVSLEPSCVRQIADWKLQILQNGLYLIYGQVAPNTLWKQLAPFDVRLLKNGTIIQIVKDNTTIQNVGGTYELHHGDTIELTFNTPHQVLQNNTYWGILLLANPQYSA
ncbi:tumor necrosis factor ligand superfamily member 18 isoform X2 [Pteronotus mesoamericanus]|uniref:tumor necrosis factor ligand superfamily member 18 isoform X2 n=1 Tax=Pteronotus mesoamericanus TaxID=1884717 RepID=UPI0023ECD74E|nr:tumor necrosis factor ligand superfamily member 18 isoform X2 [Pteronotus parnellii mesoamericanus]